MDFFRTITESGKGRPMCLPQFWTNTQVRAYIGFIERGSKSPNVDHLEKIANALKVPVIKLLLEN